MMMARRLAIVILSVVFCTLNGMLWYNPTYGCGKVWAANAWPGKSMEFVESTHNGSAYVVAALGNMLLCACLTLLIRGIHPRRYIEYLTLTFVAFLLLSASRLVHLPFESVPLVIHILDGGYDAVNLLACATLNFWMQ